jgi:hypothetical protein
LYLCGWAWLLWCRRAKYAGRRATELEKRWATNNGVHFHNQSKFTLSLPSSTWSIIQILCFTPVLIRVCDLIVHMLRLRYHPLITKTSYHNDRNYGLHIFQPGVKMPSRNNRIFGNT